MTDLPKRIWASEDLDWYSHDFPSCGFTEYVRADLVAAKDAEIARLTRERDAAVAAALESAEDAIADYPRLSPTFAEALCYDEQIEYAQDIIRSIPRDTSAIDAVVAERTAGLQGQIAEYQKTQRALLNRLFQATGKDKTLVEWVNEEAAALAKLDKPQA